MCNFKENEEFYFQSFNRCFKNLLPKKFIVLVLRHFRPFGSLSNNQDPRVRFPARVCYFPQWSVWIILCFTAIFPYYVQCIFGEANSALLSRLGLSPYSYMGSLETSCTPGLALVTVDVKRKMSEKSANM